MSVTVHTAQNMILEARELPTAETGSSAVLSAVRHVTSACSVRNQEREEAIQEEVRKSAQNVRWVTPVPSKIDHWFYDLRQCGAREVLGVQSTSSRNIFQSDRRRKIILP